jgi:hypothetical protein
MRDLGRLGSFALAAAGSFAICASIFVTSFHSARLAVVLAGLLALHVARFARLAFVREASIYSLFLAYMLLELLWTDDRLLAFNTIVPAANFVIVIVLFYSLVAFHDLEAILMGSLAGFMAGAAWYTSLSGFPFQYPAEFSYNAIAGMYLFGLSVALLGASTGRWKALYFALAAVSAIHVVATTSIKTNVGILLGVLAAGALHFGYVSRLLWRHALVVLVTAAALAIAVASNESAVASIQRGTKRVTLGLEILHARENLQGYSAFERRANWQRVGYRGWAQNPVFGHGVEAFRSKHGITSHASHVDIAYNSGLIGLGLFYGIFASMLVRLYRARHGDLRNARLVILGGVVCWVFISFAGTIHYSAVLAAFIALGTGILRRA